MFRTVYRVVKSAPLTRQDFLSNAAKGLPPSPLELGRPVLHSGISVFDSLDAIASVRRRSPNCRRIATPVLGATL